MTTTTTATQIQFLAAPEPAPALLADAAALAPTNPFVTAAFVASRRQFAGQPWALCVETGGRLVSACVAFLRAGRLNRTLEITSLPELPHAEPFWRGLLDVCGEQRVSQLAVNSFASTAVRIPKLPGEQSRRHRCEYVLDLPAGDFEMQLTTNHRRNIARARKRGLRIRRAADGPACEAHVRMVRASMERRRRRGESVPLEFSRDEFLAMTQSGAGELFQAVKDGEVLSSMLILRAALGAYSQTVGTSPDGMKCGASYLVIHEAAAALQAEGMRLFNLGGAGAEHPGLQQFKAGFGARPVDLEAAEFYLASPLRRMVSRSAQHLRRTVGDAAAALSGGVRRLGLGRHSAHEIRRVRAQGAAARPPEEAEARHA